MTWDSPPAVYAAGAFSLVFLQDVISTLADAGVQTLIVSDAVSYTHLTLPTSDLV